MASNEKPPAKPKTAKPKAPARPRKRTPGASTTPLTLSPYEARAIGDQLRGIAYLAKKLALQISEKNLPIPFHPDQVKRLSDEAYTLADELRGRGDDGSNGG